ncbi:WD40-like beta Propeller containing protein [Gemmatirosa kalamazoonensis]|uniref:WD40-like beta Propeller containing protein n=2 Tax=Gemmatirosa kalamazoonensis TaxID=861299 RepID=W0RHQ6_9BACT|nr:WD40-like beta Propeller containing protein [Gemmatirosa kalamazoonensis]
MALSTAGAQAPLGLFDGHGDVGTVRTPGTVRYDPRTEEYVISGSGQNMWAGRDDFHFVWKRMTGNFILTTRARFVGRGVEAHRKIGWTIRPTLDADGPHVTAALHGNGLVSLQTRRTRGATTEQVVSPDSLSDPSDAVVQLERRDGVYLMSVARWGDTLVTTRLADVSLPDSVYVGLYVCAHNDTVVERARFSNVRITVPAWAELRTYRDFLGSRLEILDVGSGNATVIHTYAGSFQAPNWTHDGKALVYAQDGKLYRFDLASRAPREINTAFANKNNNDHVLSFDGKLMGISDQSAPPGQSLVYVVPATGGTPRRVTERGPSYFHGFSPDGKWMAFTGQRDGVFDVYKIPTAGGAEIRLTTAEGLDDGPEYSPDGRYIYFNSSRTGRMQIWRMKPDGSEQTQITDDGFNNWFPHVSPDGKWIVYIAFPPPPEVSATDHPFYKHVTLRLMPIAGGRARVIAYLYGGQGTINVPSWSPDGKRLAFVSNTKM